MLNTWVVDLSFVASTGVLSQLFPTWTPVGVNPASAVPGNQIRRAMQGFLRAAQIKTDGSNGGYIELWDANAADLGIDVSSPAAPTFTQTNLNSLITLNRAKLIWNQNFTATSGAATPASFGKQFQFGLAARFVGSAGLCTINLDVEGGFQLNDTAGH